MLIIWFFVLPISLQKHRTKGCQYKDPVLRSVPFGPSFPEEWMALFCVPSRSWVIKTSSSFSTPWIELAIGSSSRLLTSQARDRGSRHTGGQQRAKVPRRRHRRGRLHGRRVRRVRRVHQQEGELLPELHSHLQRHLSRRHSYVRRVLRHYRGGGALRSRLSRRPAHGGRGTALVRGNHRVQPHEVLRAIPAGDAPGRRRPRRPWPSGRQVRQGLRREGHGHQHFARQAERSSGGARCWCFHCKPRWGANEGIHKLIASSILRI